MVGNKKIIRWPGKGTVEMRIISFAERQDAYLKTEAFFRMKKVERTIFSVGEFDAEMKLHQLSAILHDEHTGDRIFKDAHEAKALSESEREFLCSEYDKFETEEWEKCLSSVSE